MIFSTFAWGYTLLCAAASGALATLLTAWSFQRQDDGDARRPNSKASALFAFGVSLLIGRLVMYYVQPVFQGSYGGHWFTLALVIFPAVGACSLFSGGSRRSVLWALGAFFLLFGVPTAQYVWTCCGPYNMQKFAKLPNIKVAPPDAKIPPTEANHLVMVPDSVAIFRGQSALGAKGTQYEINQSSYTLQSVRGHRYWIAPLTYHNFVDEINLGDPSPGYVVVDAENPEADATLKLGYHIRLFTDQSWNLNLERFLYRQGFQGGALTPVKFEVDDNWEPHYVVGYVQKKFGGMGGEYLSKVIIVNVSQEEPTFTVYDASEHSKFAWVDRAMPKDVVWEYAKDYGYYSSDFAKENPIAIWWGWSKKDAMRPGDMELNYTKGDENVWVIPMTSVASSNTSVMGVLVFETNRNEGTFYPGLNNFNIGDTVKTTMFNAPANVKHYEVEHIQLVSIFGELTWVGIYTAQQEHGRSFAGIGLLHCHGQNAGDVVFASNRNEALIKYRVQLGTREAGNEKISDSAKHSPSLTGKIFRVTVDAQTAQFAITGDTTHVYVVSRETYVKVPLLRDGDEVTFNYLDTDSPQVVVTSMRCNALDGADKK